MTSTASTSSSCCRSSALTRGVELNNQGVSLLLYGRHEDAVTTLTKSLQLVQKVLRSPTDQSSSCEDEDTHHSRQRRSTSDPLPFFSLRVSCPTEQEEDDHTFRVFTNAIMIDPQPSALQTLDPSDASVIVMINLGLAFHLQVKMNQQQQSQQQQQLLYVQKVLPLYKVALDALRDNKAMNYATNHLYTMALLNNMAGIFVTLNQHGTAQRYLQMLLQHVVFVRTTSMCHQQQQQQQQPSSRSSSVTEQVALEDFHINTQGLFLKESGMAPAA